MLEELPVACKALAAKDLERHRKEERVVDRNAQLDVAEMPRTVALSEKACWARRVLFDRTERWVIETTVQAQKRGQTRRHCSAIYTKERHDLERRMPPAR